MASSGLIKVCRARYTACAPTAISNISATPVPVVHAQLLQMRAECDSAGAAGDGSVVWSEQGVWCGEPLFVANGVAGEEDDGCVLCICYDAAQERSFLLVLQVAQRSASCAPHNTHLSQATSMTELARAYSPVTIPLGLHALYADAATSTLA